MDATNNNGAGVVTLQKSEGTTADKVFKAVTPRQAQVISVISEGASLQETAENLSISRKTVEKHVNDVKVRLGAKTLAHAVKLAIKRGLVAV